MGLLSKVLKAAVGGILANKAARSAALAGMVRYIGYLFRPKNASKTASVMSGLGRKAAGSLGSDIFSKLLHAAAEILILRLFAKRGGLFGAAILSALAAMLLASKRGGKDAAQSYAYGESGRIIDHSDYTILDDRR